MEQNNEEKILMMTVGTGVGLNKEEKIRNLAHGLLHCINHYKPAQIIYFGSEESKETMQMVEILAKEQHICLPNLKKEVFLKNIDDFDSCFGTIQGEIEEFKRNKEKQFEIYIDYTSGTKTMTAAIVVLSILYHLKLSLVSGTRSDQNVVRSGTEKMQEQNPYRVYDKLLMEKLHESFNTYRFNTAREYLHQIVDLLPEKKAYYEHLIDAYDAWDKFDHLGAFDKLSKITKAEDPSGLLNNNKAFLGTMVNFIETDTQTDSPNRINMYYIADLLNNAGRRMEEGKYDDAVARLYRTMEFIEQHIFMTKYNLKSNDLEVIVLRERKIPENYIGELEDLKDTNGKIKIGLKRGYEILAKLSEEIGSKYMNDNKLQNLLTKRNDSILAHGIKPVKKEDCEDLYQIVEIYIGSVFRDMIYYTEKARFIKLD